MICIDKWAGLPSRGSGSLAEILPHLQLQPSDELRSAQLFFSLGVSRLSSSSLLFFVATSLGFFLSASLLIPAPSRCTKRALNSSLLPSFLPALLSPLSILAFTV